MSTPSRIPTSERTARGAYYNEIDPVACAVLVELINCGVIADGVVDDRSISEVSPDDVLGFTQCHFFAGAGLWSIACRSAEWADDRPIWTASCPCQGWSVAGKGLGFDDPRDLWPDLFRLCRAVRPDVVVGEITSGSAILPWLDRTCADLEGEDYACRAVSVPACAVDAPNIRQRLWWSALADASNRGQQWAFAGRREARRFIGGDGGDVADAASDGWQQRVAGAAATRHRHIAPSEDGGALAHPKHSVWWTHDDLRRSVNSAQEERRIKSATEFRKRDNPSCSFWADAEWIACADGKARRAKPGLRMLVDGMVGRVDLWRLAGNSINPILAAEVIKALADEIATRSVPEAA